MTVLLAPDPVDLYPPAGATDAHGWALPGPDAVWSGMGNLQLTQGRSEPLAADSGGAVYAPAATAQGTLLLPQDAPVAEGWLAAVRGRLLALRNVRLMPDPTHVAGGLTCWEALAYDTGGWPGA